MSDKEKDLQFEGAHGYAHVGKQSGNLTIAERNKAIDEAFKILPADRAEQMADYHKGLESFWRSEAEAKKGES